MDIPANNDDPGPTPRFLKNAAPNKGKTLAITDLGLVLLANTQMDKWTMVKLTETSRFQRRRIPGSVGKIRRGTLI
jgi:hypothetical protein